ncbi:MAG: aminoglycoside phosphotransferase [Herbinix sp.]|jgi:aminoglycoside phosphotransferase (APT) family kinase protein|nr:aminoglycoside phosphotransferase [Herbinix sp.]
MIKMIELNKLKLLAQGGQAEIYELDENKVIRVLRNKEDEEYLKVELSVMKSLKEKDKAVPTVYEYRKIEERPSLIMERLNGDSMLEQIRKSPLQILNYAERLATLHMEIADSAEGLGLISINDRAAHLIPKSELLEPKLKEFILTILSEMPRGNDICHGDFHPGNIIITKGQYYVIDWFGATSGNKLSDIAHTYLILRNTPRLPGITGFQNFIISRSASVISGRYLSTCAKLQPFDRSEFSRWMVIRAAERVFYGSPFEKEALIKFLRKCWNAQASGVQANRWWQFI